MSAPRTVMLCGRQLDEPGHLGAFFDSRREEYDELPPYYKEGIELDEEVITIFDDARRKDRCSWIEQRGIEVADV